ncbi:MAG TPA: 50S ribosomal protein L3 [Woeseiaceae bacterium]|nr:50S ribosomal protein L3 [Woeseiaceae bacterium]
MTMGLVGRKCGMTRVFTDDGVSIPVTVIEAEPNRVTQVKTEERDGYRALQVTAGRRKPGRLTKPVAGHFAAAGVEPGDVLTEFRLGDGEGADLAPGAEIRVDVFAPGQKVDVIGTSIGKGFAGTIKRHNFRSQDASHGNSLSHRAPGSIGQNQSPGRVFPGKRMAGHLGNVRCTVQNLEVVRVDAERNLILVKGAVPGHRGARVVVRPAVKAKNKGAA